MVTIRESDKIIFVNIKNSYEALRNNDRSNPLYRDSVYNCTVNIGALQTKKPLLQPIFLGVIKEKLLKL